MDMAWFFPMLPSFPEAFTVQVSANASAWTDLVTQSVGQDSTFSADLDSPDPIKFVRILMSAKDDPATFAEIYVYGEEMPKPAQPIATAASDVTESGFIANWEASVGATGYVISVATDVGFTNILPGYDEWGDNILSGMYLTWIRELIISTGFVPLTLPEPAPLETSLL